MTNIITFSITDDNTQFLQNQPKGEKSKLINLLLENHRLRAKPNKENITTKEQATQRKKESFQKGIQHFSPPIRKTLRILFNIYLCDPEKHFDIEKLIFLHVTQAKSTEKRIINILLHMELITQKQTNWYLNQGKFFEFLLKINHSWGDENG